MVGIGVALALGLTVVCTVHGPADADTPTAVTNLVIQPAIPVPGAAGKFDFMAADAAYNHIFAAHPGNSSVAVVDTATSQVTVVNTVGSVNGTAIDDIDNRVFVAGPGKKLFALDRKSLQQTGELDLPGPADSLAFDAKNDRVYVDNDDGTNVWVVDPKAMAITATVTIHGAPEVMVYNSIDDHIYQNIKPKDEIVAIDPATNAVTATWSTAPARSPHGLALDSKTQRLFSAGANGTLVVVDIRSGKVIASVSVASKVDQIAFDQSLGRVYCASPTGMLSVVQETDTGAVFVGNVASAPNTASVAVDNNTHDVWVCYTDKEHSYLQRFKYSGEEPSK